jgi:uncharacterized cupredoxin-like copper-binding protein
MLKLSYPPPSLTSTDRRKAIVASFFLVIVAVSAVVGAYVATGVFKVQGCDVNPSPTARASHASTPTPTSIYTPTPSTSTSISTSTPISTPKPSTTPGSTAGDWSIGLVLYAGEINASTYGFGYSASSISSPGPSLAFKVGQRYTVTLVNVGTKSHNWALANAKSSNATVIGGQIGSASNPVAPGAIQSINLGPFTTADNLYYICQVDEHVSFGMWGTVTIAP